MAIKQSDQARLGQRIRELRKNARLTQEELGEKTGISYKYLGSIERGLENPSFKHLTKIAKALGVSLPVLFEFEHLEPNREELIREINRVLGRMSPSEVRLAYKVLKSIAS